MKALFTGKSRTGANQMRAEQVSEGLRAIDGDARAITNASLEDCRAADIIVLVKRPTSELLDAIRASRKPFIWDIVDAWPQPEGNEWTRSQALDWLHRSIQHVQPDHLICATKAMLADAEFPSASVIYHHARPEYVDAKRAHASCAFVGYEGGEHYLGRYDQALQREMRARGWGFNFESISGADVAVCLRDCKGYAPRHWKSNVKLANAQALGIPALCSPESGYKETSTGGFLWIESPEDLPAAFAELANPERYAELCAEVGAPPTLESVARQYKALLETLA